MAALLSRATINPSTRAKYWPAHNAAAHDRDARSDLVVADPVFFVATLCKNFSVPCDDALLALARAPPPDKKWWPRWVLDAPQLRKHIGARVELTESTLLFGARFVWVGVPFPFSSPTAADVVGSPSGRFFAPCMVSLVTHDRPRNKQAYIWCTINRDGDAVELSEDLLCSLLATEIAHLKTQARRAGAVNMDGSADGNRDGFIEAAQLMAMNVSGLPGIDASTLTMYQVPSDQSESDASHLTPVPIRTLKNREAVLKVVTASIVKKRATGAPIVNPLLPADATPAHRDKLLAILQYFVHYGQFDPATKAILRNPPHNDDTAAIYADPNFAEFVRLHADLFRRE